MRELGPLVGPAPQGPMPLRLAHLLRDWIDECPARERWRRVCIVVCIHTRMGKDGGASCCGTRQEFGGGRDLPPAPRAEGPEEDAEEKEDADQTANDSARDGASVGMP